MRQNTAKLKATVIAINSVTESIEQEKRDAETRLLCKVRDNGDEGAFAALFDSFAGRLRGYLGTLGCEASTADTITQEVLINVWTKAKLFDETKASARTWIYTLTRNRLIDHKRSEGRQKKAYERFADEHNETTYIDNSGAQQIANRQVAALLDQLPSEQSEILLLAYVEGKSHREIATELNIPIGTTKSRVRLAFQRLRTLLEEQA